VQLHNFVLKSSRRCTGNEQFPPFHIKSTISFISNPVVSVYTWSKNEKRSKNDVISSVQKHYCALGLGLDLELELKLKLELELELELVFGLELKLELELELELGLGLGLGLVLRLELELVLG